MSLCLVDDAIMSINEHEILAARLAMVAAADAMLAGQTSFIDGVRIIVGLFPKARLSSHDPAFLPFDGAYGETAHVPSAEMRRLWSPTALAREQPKWNRVEAWARDFLQPACRDLAAELAKRPIV